MMAVILPPRWMALPQRTWPILSNRPWTLPNEKRKSRKDAGEEVGDLTADEVIQEAAEIIDAMTADEGMDDDEADPEGKDDDEADSDEKDDDEAASEDDAKRRKSAAFRRQVKSGTAPAQRKYSSLFMGGIAFCQEAAEERSPAGESRPRHQVSGCLRPA